MKKIDKKIRTEHSIMDEFIPFLNDIAKNIYTDRIIPGRITRKQSGSSDVFITFAYFNDSWLKYNVKKWSTSQEIFVICNNAYKQQMSEYISDISQKYINN